MLNQLIAQLADAFVQAVQAATGLTQLGDISGGRRRRRRRRRGPKPR